MATNHLGCNNSSGTFPILSKDRSFQETKITDGWLLKRTMVEKNGESSLRTIGNQTASDHNKSRLAICPQRGPPKKPEFRNSGTEPSLRPSFGLSPGQPIAQKPSVPLEASFREVALLALAKIQATAILGRSLERDTPKGFWGCEQFRRNGTPLCFARLTDGTAKPRLQCDRPHQGQLLALTRWLPSFQTEA